MSKQDDSEAPAGASSSLSGLGARGKPHGGATSISHDFEAHGGSIQREIREKCTAHPTGAVGVAQARQAASVILALRADVCALESEVRAIRGSARFRLGDRLMLSTTAPFRHAPGLLWFMLKMLVSGWRRRPRRATVRETAGHQDLALARALVFGESLPCESWSTDGPTLCVRDAALVAKWLDEGSLRTDQVLVLRRPSSVLARRVIRCQLAGMRIMWWPETTSFGDQHDTAIARYLAAHCERPPRSSDGLGHMS